MRQEVIEIYEKLKGLNIDELDWLIRNVIYIKSENIKIEDHQSLFLSQMLRVTSSLFKQSINGQNFDPGYLKKYYNYK